MKLVHALRKIYEVLADANTVRASRLLLQQRQLLYSGIEVSAEVMDIYYSWKKQWAQCILFGYESN